MIALLVVLIGLFSGAVVSKEFACLPGPLRRLSVIVHRNRTLARVLSFLIVLVVKCLADSTVVSGNEFIALPLVCHLV